MNLNIPRLILPQNFAMKRFKIIQWFRQTDEKLTNFVENGKLDVNMAQCYFKMKVEGNEDLSMEDKQRIADESKLWKIPIK